MYFCNCKNTRCNHVMSIAVCKVNTDVLKYHWNHAHYVTKGQIDKIKY